MNNPGATPEPFDLLVRTRTVLLDALDALDEHRDSVIVVGAQAVYLHTGDAPVAIAEATKDADVAIDTRGLGQDPTIDAAMRKARFEYNREQPQPGAWVSADGIPVDIMVPEALAGPGKPGKRSVVAPPHNKMAMRRSRGLEAAIVDHSEMTVPSLDPHDTRSTTALVAGPAALIVAKCHKITERLESPSRLQDKDAHDVYRILVAVPTERLRASFAVLLVDEISSTVTSEAVDHLHELFAAGPDAIGSVMAGRTEEAVGDPEQVAVAISFLASDLVGVIRATRGR
ncbi:hypothetical protein [Nocardia vaccinii]|uniref:hypothetical protein n=1 Tax=Nocardia vaccinii TaxID=1822 RepID=UPI0008332AEF|nr:hypothetical protein [Nocardia vaccinii]